MYRGSLSACSVLVVSFWVIDSTMAIGPVCGAVRGAPLVGALLYMVAWFWRHPTHRVGALRGWSQVDLAGHMPTAGGADASAEHSATTTFAQARGLGGGDGTAAFAANYYATGGAGRELPGGASDAQLLSASEPAPLRVADGSMRSTRARSSGHGDSESAFAMIDLVVDTATGGAGREHPGGAGGAHPFSAAEPALLSNADADGRLRRAA